MNANNIRVHIYRGFPTPNYRIQGKSWKAAKSQYRAGN
jgi:hypothetical protein